MTRLLTLAAMTLSLVVPAPARYGPQDTSSPSREMKASGSEVGKAGKSMGRNVKHGRVVRGGKHFGKHFGRAGKHFGRGTKKAFRRAIS